MAQTKVVLFMANHRYTAQASANDKNGTPMGNIRLAIGSRGSALYNAASPMAFTPYFDSELHREGKL